jgi:hypothetical protein
MLFFSDQNKVDKQIRSNKNVRKISEIYMWNKVNKKSCGDSDLVLVHSYFIWKVPIFLPLIFSRKGRSVRFDNNIRSMRSDVNF